MCADGHIPNHCHDDTTNDYKYPVLWEEEEIGVVERGGKERKRERQRDRGGGGGREEGRRKGEQLKEREGVKGSIR